MCTWRAEVGKIKIVYLLSLSLPSTRRGVRSFYSGDPDLTSEQCEHVGWPDHFMSVCLARSQLGTSLAWQTQLPAAMSDYTSLLNQVHVHCTVPQLLQLISSPLLNPCHTNTTHIPLRRRLFLLQPLFETVTSSIPVSPWVLLLKDKNNNVRYSFADLDPEPGAFLTLRSGICFLRILDPKPTIWELSNHFLDKNTIILCQLAQIFPVPLSKNIISVCEIEGYKKNDRQLPSNHLISSRRIISSQQRKIFVRLW